MTTATSTSTNSNSNGNVNGSRMNKTDSEHEHPATSTMDTTTSTTNNTTPPVQTVIPLVPVVKEYAWGIRGMDSRVARYALESKAIREIDADVPYAELWIGTHPSGAASLLLSNENGDTNATTTTTVPLRQQVGRDLPFLFKILSAGKALSIQAHPDLETAQALHKRDPVHYKDPNHKPEMAIALTPFEAMCGFRRLDEISILLKKHAEFAACISTEAKLDIFLAQTKDEQRNALRQMLHSFMTCPPKVSSVQLAKLLQRLQCEEMNVHPHPHDSPPWERKCARAILRLAKQFPNDATAMAPFFLNYLLIAPGESFFMAANEPHAYVAGEIIECMACSDNVVRAGLTPKFKDVSVLCRMLSYSQGGPSIDAGAPLEGDVRILRYTPPVPEFEVLVLTCRPGDSLSLHVPTTQPAIVVILEGTGLLQHCTSSNSSGSGENGVSSCDKDKDSILCQPGQCYYHPAEANAICVRVPSTKRGPLKVAVAHENLHLEVPTTYKRKSTIVEEHSLPPTPFVSPTVFRGDHVDRLSHLSVNEYDYEG